MAVIVVVVVVVAGRGDCGRSTRQVLSSSSAAACVSLLRRGSDARIGHAHRVLTAIARVHASRVGRARRLQATATATHVRRIAVVHVVGHVGRGEGAHGHHRVAATIGAVVVGRSGRGDVVKCRVVLRIQIDLVGRRLIDGRRGHADGCRVVHARVQVVATTSSSSSSTATLSHILNAIVGSGGSVAVEVGVECGRERVVVGRLGGRAEHGRVVSIVIVVVVVFIAIGVRVGVVVVGGGCGGGGSRVDAAVAERGGECGAGRRRRRCLVG